MPGSFLNPQTLYRKFGVSLPSYWGLWPLYHSETFCVWSLAVPQAEALLAQFRTLGCSVEVLQQQHGGSFADSAQLLGDQRKRQGKQREESAGCRANADAWLWQQEPQKSKNLSADILAVYTADCVPALLLAENTEKEAAGALLHLGGAGVLKNACCRLVWRL